MTSLESLTTLYRDLESADKKAPSSKICLKVTGSNSDQHVVVVNGFFSRLWARVASFFGSASYQSKAIQEVLLKDIRVLKNSSEKSSQLITTTKGIDHLFTKYIQDKLFTAEFGTEEEKEELIQTVHELADAILSFEAPQQRAPAAVALQWRQLAKVEKENELFPKTLMPYRDFLSHLIGRPIESIFSKTMNSEEQLFKRIREVVEKHLKELGDQMTQLMSICQEGSLEYTIYKKAQSLFQSNIAALQSKENDTWGQNLEALKPQIAKYESFLVKLTDKGHLNPKIVEEAVQEVLADIEQFWKETEVSNAKKWISWNKIGIPDNIHQNLQRMHAEVQKTKNLEVVVQVAQEAERAGMNLGNRLQELIRLHGVLHKAPADTVAPKIPAVTPKETTAFDQALQEVGDHLGLNVKGFIDLRIAVIQRFNELYKQLSAHPQFKACGTMIYQLLRSIHDAFNKVSQEVDHQTPAAKKKQLYQMMQRVLECQLLAESLEQPPSKRAELAKALLLLRTTLDVASGLPLSRIVYSDDIYEELPLSRHPPHAIDMAALLRFDSFKMKRVLHIFDKAFEQLEPVQKVWNREKCEQLRNDEELHYPLFEDFQAAIDEVRLALVEIQLKEMKKVARDELAPSIIQETLDALHNLQLPKKSSEKEALQQLFNLADQRSELLQRAEIILQRDPRAYGKLLFVTLAKSDKQDIDFETGTRQEILTACRKELQDKVQPQQLEALEKVLRRIPRKL